MKQISQFLNGFGEFMHGVGAEFRKTTWPQRRELTESTVAVIVFVLLLSLFILVFDQVLVTLLQWITPS